MSPRQPDYEALRAQQARSQQAGPDRDCGELPHAADGWPERNQMLAHSRTRRSLQMNHDDPDYVDRVNRALYTIQQQRGNGAWNLAHIEHILNGKDRG